MRPVTYLCARCQSSGRWLATKWRSISNNSKRHSKEPLKNVTELMTAYTAPYRLNGQQRWHALQQRAFYATVGACGVYAGAQLWETWKQKPGQRENLPMLQVTRWSLLIPYGMLVSATSCVLALWRIRPMTTLSMGEMFLRMFVDKFGLTPKVLYSRPLVSPLLAALSHRSVLHYCATQIVLASVMLGCYGKMSPGEFVSFFALAAFASSLATVLSMCLTRHCVAFYGSSSVLAAFVAFNAMTPGEGIIDRPSPDAEQGSNVALLGVLPVPGTPLQVLSAWAAVEAACFGLSAARLMPLALAKFNHIGHIAGIAIGCLYASVLRQWLWSHLPVPERVRAAGVAAATAAVVVDV